MLTPHEPLALTSGGRPGTVVFFYSTREVLRSSICCGGRVGTGGDAGTLGIRQGQVSSIHSLPIVSAKLTLATGKSGCLCSQ